MPVFLQMITAAFILAMIIYTVAANLLWEDRRDQYLDDARQVLRKFLEELQDEYKRLPPELSPDHYALMNEMKRLIFSLPRKDENSRWRAWDVWHWRRLKSRDPKTWKRVREFDKTGYINTH